MEISIKNFKKIYLVLTVLGIRCCVGFFSTVVSGGYSLVVMCRFLIALAALVEHGINRVQGFSSCGMWAQ